ncbi:MAG: magnesium-translocating P-type ATPase [Gammaproteobacteria bacterium GWE2_42_36]|nr:MAG: magnesium-translocating P-type ATPase [Gammaproteobacteria bacterium GWE2_42_36]
MQSNLNGLSELVAKSLLSQYGLNEIEREKRQSWIGRLFTNFKNPLLLLLMTLGVISYFTGDIRSTIIIFVMVILCVVLRFVQETRADHAAEKLKEMVRNNATVVREGNVQEIALKRLVPGDVIQLSAGDMIPADVRVIAAKDLFLNQSALTGEALPIEKKSFSVDTDIKNPLDLINICFLGSNVVSGSATAIVINTGCRTYFGSLARSIMSDRQLTSFDKGINQFTWLMIKFIAVMVPAVFFINGFTKHDWSEAFLFALAVAVGLTPEMLPMIVTVNLSKGALMMARKKTIVKRLNSIQNFGAMNILCTDKTGTLTEGRIVLERHVDVCGKESAPVLHFGYLNSYHHTGLKNLLDDAILDHEDLEDRLKMKEQYKKIDEIPFDFSRRRMSVVVEDINKTHILICKGAFEEVMSQCDRIEMHDDIVTMLPEYVAQSRDVVTRLNAEGFRVIALAYKKISGLSVQTVYSVKDESNLVLLGFLSFFDPPKESAEEALKRLHTLNVNVKILTGDNDVVTAYICNKVGILVENILLGSQVEAMTEAELAEAAINTNVFARLLPAHKEKIIRALQSKAHVVGFLGDGINDAPALKAADVGISVNSAVDIAKESSDIILLKNSLLVLGQGVLEGRRIFGNIMKYIKMAASSNFGNMFSVMGASAFLPFLPMLPIQVLVNNLLYDFSQTTIPTDKVDRDWLQKPRKWTMGKLTGFILLIGPISSVFDYVTYYLMLHVFHCWNNPALFHTGWFVESIFTQTLIIHVIRTNKIPFFQSWASGSLIVSSLLIVGIAAWLPVSPFASALGFVSLPSSYWLFLAGILLCYVGLTQIVKSWFFRKYGD